MRAPLLAVVMTARQSGRGQAAERKQAESKQQIQP